jgi:hypothetical protein
MIYYFNTLTIEIRRNQIKINKQKIENDEDDEKFFTDDDPFGDFEF